MTFLVPQAKKYIVPRLDKKWYFIHKIIVLLIMKMLLVV